MNFSLDASRNLLSRTPAVLRTLLEGLPDAWVHSTEGGDSWSPYQVVGHLVHGEKTDWIPRLRIILSEGAQKTFEPFVRFAMLQWDPSVPLTQLLEEFEQLRAQNLQELAAHRLQPSDLQRQGLHPALGPVTLAQLIASWVAHDLSHLAQVSRVLAYPYKEAVGPWVAYMRIFQ